MNSNVPLSKTPATPAAAPALRPQPGAGLLLTSNSIGFSYSAPGESATFSHPFRAALGSMSMRFARGLVEGREATIGKLPISGGVNGEVPILQLDPGKANADGESWACLEVEPDKAGLLTAAGRREIVHANEPISLDPLIGRVPLALIIWRDKRPLRAVQAVFFNLRYVRYLPAPGGGAVRHFFP